MRFYDLLIKIYILICPSISIMIYKWSMCRKEKKERRLILFYALCHRNSNIELLNKIPIEFRNHKKIIKSYEIYTERKSIINNYDKDNLYLFNLADYELDRLYSNLLIEINKYLKIRSLEDFTCIKSLISKFSL